MTKPIIGIVGSLFKEKNPSFIGDSFDYNHNNYSKCIVKAGGIPIYLPVINSSDILDEYLSICDGLLLPGGADINPLFYNELPKPLQGKSNDLIDSYQINITKKALKLTLPILGICRGIQILNIAAGGTIYQDVSYAVESPIRHNQNSHISDNCHPIYIYNNSKLNDILGNKFIVNSGHHQSIHDIGSNFKKVALSPDGIIEAIELNDTRFVLGVQWHPEMMALNNNSMLQLFIKFISNCKNPLSQDIKN